VPRGGFLEQTDVASEMRPGAGAGRTRSYCGTRMIAVVIDPSRDIEDLMGMPGVGCGNGDYRARPKAR
jgi:hypothetical protein